MESEIGFLRKNRKKFTPQTKEEFYKNHQERIAQKLGTHRDVVDYIRGHILGSGYTKETLIKHAEEKYLSFPQMFHPMKWFYFCVVGTLRNVRYKEQWDMLLKEAKLPKRFQDS